MKSKLKPKGTVEYVHIEDILIPPEYAFSHPSKNKIKEYTKRYERLGCLDEPITVIP